jgi:transcription antitermination factor NusG
MPILPTETSLYPDNLFGDAEFTLPEHTWWVLHTRPRQEKSLARQLLSARSPFFLPLAARRNLMRGRVVESRLPLFSGYLFLLAGPDERVSALATKRVARAIPAPDGAALWRDLKQIHRLIAAGLPLTPEERLSPGTPVEIRSGPLVGMRGTVVRAASGRRFVVSVDFIGCGASVTLDDYMLYPAPKAAV